MNIPEEPTPPKNTLRRTLIFAIILLIAALALGAYGLSPRPFTDDPELHSAPQEKYLLIQAFSEVLDREVL